MRRCIRLLQPLVEIVDAHNFRELKHVIGGKLQDAAFCAFDCEFSGVPQRDWTTATPQRLYQDVKSFAESAALTQVGLSIFTPDESGELSHSTYSVFIAPPLNFVCTAPSLRLLVDRGYDFSRWLNHGVPSAEFTSLFQAVLASAVPLVGFQCLLDVMLCFACFVEALPHSVEGFLQKVGQCFPRIIDLRYVASKDPRHTTEGLSLLRHYTQACELHDLKRAVSHKDVHDAGVDAYITGIAHSVFSKESGQDPSHSRAGQHDNKLFVYGVPFCFDIAAPKVFAGYSKSLLIHNGALHDDGYSRGLLPPAFAPYGIPFEDVHWLQFRRVALLTFASDERRELALDVVTDEEWEVHNTEEEPERVTFLGLPPTPPNPEPHTPPPRECPEICMHSAREVPEIRATARRNRRRGQNHRARVRRTRQLRSLLTHLRAELRSSNDERSALLGQVGILGQGLRSYQAQNQTLREQLKAGGSRSSEGAVRPDAVGPAPKAKPAARPSGQHTALKASTAMKKSQWSPPSGPSLSRSGADSFLERKRREKEEALTKAGREAKAEPRPGGDTRQRATVPAGGDGHRAPRATRAPSEPPKLTLGKATPRVLVDVTKRTWKISDYVQPLMLVLLPTQSTDQPWNIEARHCAKITVVSPYIGATLWQDCKGVSAYSSHPFLKRATHIGGFQMERISAFYSSQLRSLSDAVELSISLAATKGLPILYVWFESTSGSSAVVSSPTQPAWLDVLSGQGDRVIELRHDTHAPEA